MAGVVLVLIAPEAPVEPLELPAALTLVLLLLMLVVLTSLETPAEEEGTVEYPGTVVVVVDTPVVSVEEDLVAWLQPPRIRPRRATT